MITGNSGGCGQGNVHIALGLIYRRRRELLEYLDGIFFSKDSLQLFGEAFNDRRDLWVSNAYFSSARVVIRCTPDYISAR